MEDNEEENYFLANPVNPNGRVMNNANNIVENNVNNNINTDINNARKNTGSDKIIVSYHLGCFEVGFMFIFSILFIVFPFFFYRLILGFVQTEDGQSESMKSSHCVAFPFCPKVFS